MTKNKPIPIKFLTFEPDELNDRILELKNLLFYRECNNQLDKIYYNCWSILEAYLILKEHVNADAFTKQVLEELLFTYEEKRV